MQQEYLITKHFYFSFSQLFLLCTLFVAPSKKEENELTAVNTTGKFVDT
jgi:hypothetical protein